MYLLKGPMMFGWIDQSSALDLWAQTIIYQTLVSLNSIEAQSSCMSQVNTREYLSTLSAFFNLSIRVTFNMYAAKNSLVSMPPCLANSNSPSFGHRLGMVFLTLFLLAANCFLKLGPVSNGLSLTKIYLPLLWFNWSLFSL